MAPGIVLTGGGPPVREENPGLHLGMSLAPESARRGRAHLLVCGCSHGVCAVLAVSEALLLYSSLPSFFYPLPPRDRTHNAPPPATV